MDNNINYKAIEEYCNELTTKLLEPHKKDQFSGEDLLQITPIKQINLFIIKSIFTQWRVETEQVRSPFFNYESGDVKKALQTYMNVLSRNIQVAKNDLKGLMQQSIKESLLLIYSPYDYYAYVLIPKDKSMLLQEFEGLKKYIKINRDIFDGIIKQAGKDSIEILDSQKLQHLLSEVLNKTDATPEDTRPYTETFSNLIPLDDSIIYGTPEKEDREVDESKDDQKAEDDSDQSVLNDSFEKENKTLNDKLQKKKKTLAERHEEEKLKDIKNSLSINQRFMFINTLFSGNEQEFQNTIDKIESSSFDDAVDYLKQNFDHWNLESEEVEEFFEIIEKRLS